MSSKNMRHAFVTMGTIVAATVSFVMPTSGLAVQPEATSGPTYSCESVMMPAATPGPDAGSMTDGAMGSPMAGMEMETGIDLLYIDMMIPHHASIIAMSEAALPRLTDERLQEIAGNIIEAQSAEIEELRGLRQDLVGTMSMPMDEMPMDMMMGMMMELMPGLGSMDEMAIQMDPVAQVKAICEAEDPDLAFIELTIPHHEMASTASEAVLEQSTNDEVRAFAERVIADQQAEIETLQEIRREL